MQRIGYMSDRILARALPLRASSSGSEHDRQYYLLAQPPGLLHLSPRYACTNAAFSVPIHNNGLDKALPII